MGLGSLMIGRWIPDRQTQADGIFTGVGSILIQALGGGGGGGGGGRKELGGREIR